MLEVTRIIIREKGANEKNSKIVAYADITINNAIAIHGIKILMGDSGEYIAFPSRKDINNGKYYDVCHPINQEARTIISNAILNEFNKQ